MRSAGAESLVADLRAAVRGRVIAPGDAEYDEARTPFYGGFDRRPVAIARVADADDVARVIAFARDTGIELAVRDGGHSPAAHSTSDGGIVLDVGELTTLEIDSGGRTAWAGAGLTARGVHRGGPRARARDRVRRHRLGRDR